MQIGIGLGIGKCDKRRRQGEPPGPVYEPEVVAYNALMATPLSEAHLNKINNFVLSLKTGFGITVLSDAFDFIHLYSNETQEAALKNLVKNAHHGVAVNSPLFTQYFGFKGNGTNAYIDSNFAPSQGIRYTQNNATYGAYSNTNILQTSQLMGTRAGTNHISTLVPNFSTQLTNFYINSTHQHSTSSGGNSLGLYTITRNANAVKLYKNGAEAASFTSTSTGLSIYTFYVLGRNNAGVAETLTTREVAFAFAGRALTANEVTILYNAFADYRAT